MKHTFPFLVLILLAGCGADDPIPTRLRARLESVLDIGHKQPTPDDLREALVRRLRQPSRESIRAFYEKRQYHLAWSDGVNGPIVETATLLGALHRAGEHGLMPEEYAVDRLEALARDIRGSKRNDEAAARLADFDLLATTSFFRYASDVSTGRIHPEEVESDWHTDATELNVVEALDTALGRGGFQNLLLSLPPPHPGYTRLCEALVNLREIEAAGGWPTIPSGPNIVPGSHGPRVALLRQRLGESSPGESYDAALARAVRSFQIAHGITPDGIVTEPTVEELNVPVGDRIRQVELNLERWRWIPRDLGDPHVLVNIPGFDLTLFHGGAPSWRTRVVAGKAYTPTPVFSDRIVAIVVNPPWSVPESIAVKEYLPELRKNPRALADQGLRLLEGPADRPREVDSKGVDWQKVDEDRFPYRIRQDPGDKNPLGRLKFDLTNDFQIYLHDTPAGGVFSRSDRGLSHGCIRVQNALEFADQISDDGAREKIHQALEEPDEQRVELTAKIPVHILYWTAWADEAGNLETGPDLYGFDRSQREALDRVTGNKSVAEDNSPGRSYN